MANVTRQFGDCILGVRFTDLPRPAVDIARQVTLDGLAVMLAGVTELLDVGRIVIKYVRGPSARHGAHHRRSARQDP
jgi:hypothetical protein